MPRFGLVITPEEADAVQVRRDKLAAVGPQVSTLHVDPVAGHTAEAMTRLACRSSRPDRVLGIAAERNGRLQLWLANITDAPQTDGVAAAFRRVAALDRITWAAASRGAEPATAPSRDGRLLLEPYAIARLES